MHKVQTIKMNSKISHNLKCKFENKLKKKVLEWVTVLKHCVKRRVNVLWKFKRIFSH